MVAVTQITISRNYNYPTIHSSFSTMAEPKSMKILSICKVVPADSPSHFSLPLTFLDVFFLQAKPTSRIFFYELSEPNTDIYHTILPNLKHSLSLTLKHYLPLTGNITWPQDSDLPIIQYNPGDGVSLTIAETQSDFHYLSGDAFRESAELRSLLPNFPSSETISPAMTLQISVFPKRGFSIAYMVNHAVMDGKSTSMFMHSWAYICKNGDASILPPELTPSFDRTFVEHFKELEKLFPKGFGPVDPKSKKLPIFDMTPPPMVLGTFKLTRENIEALKKKVRTNHPRVSTFTVTSAYVGICLTRAKKIAADTTTLGFSVDCRLRLDPPLPPTYFGNCLVISGHGTDTKDLLAEDGFTIAVNDICEALATLNESVLKEVEIVNNAIATSVTKRSAVFAIGGSPRFELYKVDFGWGNPVKVEMISIDSGRGIYLSDDRDGNGGIEIGVALNKHEADDFSTLFRKGLEARYVRQEMK